LFGGRESLRCQIVFDREMRELYDFAAFAIDNGDKT
jgi:hypothetical protein